MTEEIIVTGIVAGSEDYKESDKIVKIITPDLGTVNAQIRGVKKEKAKLKFSAMPFSFCEFTLLKRGNYYTVKTATQIESLFAVTYDPDKYLAGSIMLETACYAVGETRSADIFVYLLAAIKRLIYSEVQPYSLCVNFVYRLLVSGGYTAPSALNESYSVDIEIQKDIGDIEYVLRLLKQLLKFFEKNYVCKLKTIKII